MLNHLAIIADGNRRWAKKNNLPKAFGYQQALGVIENCCEWAISNNIKYLTFYVFSTENWNRTPEEIEMIMNLGMMYFLKAGWYKNKGIQVKFIGKRDRLRKKLVDNCNNLENETKNNTNLHLNICLDYGGRNEIEEAISAGARTEKEITNYLHNKMPDPDIILRTGGDKRLSNFLLWQSAYSELFFIDTFFPDLKTTELDKIKEEFFKRKRNFGK